MKELRFNRYIAPAAAGLVLAVGAAACGNSLKTSPAAESRAYPGDPNAYGSNPAHWHEAVVAETEVPADAKDIIVGFEVPHSDNWTDSEPIEPTEAGKILLRIGPGPVEFRVQAQGDASSKAVEAPPKVIFEGPEPYSKAIKDPQVRVPSGWKSH